MPYGIKIETVRLKVRSDHYCGQHPGPCRVGNRNSNFGKHGAFYLEGLDWIELNYLLNDVLDALGLEADIWSYNREARGGRYYVRRGRCRRVRYGSETEEFYGRIFEHWTEATDADFLDCVGRTPPFPEFPAGTPGSFTLQVEGGKLEAV